MKNPAYDKAWLYWLPAFIYMALIFVMSSFPAPEAVKSAPIVFQIKFVHIVEYGILSALVLLGLLKTSNRKGLNLYLTATLIVLLYGASDEFHQHFIPGRTGRALDLVANLIGIILACISYEFSKRLRSR